MERYKVSATIADKGIVMEHSLTTEANSVDEAVETFVEWLTDRYANSPEVLKALPKCEWNLA